MEIVVFSYILVLIILLVILAIFAYISRDYQKQEIDYFAFFLIGIVWLIIGATIKNNILALMGFIFGITGFIHRRDWEKNRRDWIRLEKGEKT
tara:strand:- start:145 stop:423 length:279 start_codon:yes stop_codon:yes gene_type:complete